MDLAHSANRMVAAGRDDIIPLQASVLRPPFADGAFDVVVSTSTLDHFTTPECIWASLDALCRLLKPSGVLVLTMDNPANPLIRLRGGRMLSALRKIRMVPYHVGPTACAGKLREHLEKSGLTVEMVDHVMHFPRVVGLHAANLTDRLGIGFGQKLLLRTMAVCEHLVPGWLRAVTGHYSAIIARKRQRH
jgi:SAM-dependent methyltransferase